MVGRPPISLLVDGQDQRGLELEWDTAKDFIDRLAEPRLTYIYECGDTPDPNFLRNKNAMMSVHEHTAFWRFPDGNRPEPPLRVRRLSYQVVDVAFGPPVFTPGGTDGLS